MSIGIIIFIAVIALLVGLFVAWIINFHKMCDLMVYGIDYKEKKAEEKERYKRYRAEEKLNKKNKSRG